jgi:Flp pilus assembly protein TadD/peroxiredoxin
LPFAPSPRFPASTHLQENEILPNASEAWLVDPILAPDFNHPDQQGNMQRLMDFEGQPLVLVFWQPDCQQSQKQLQTMQTLWPELQRNKLKLLAIRGDDPQRTTGNRRSTIDRGFSFPVLAGDENTRAVYNIFHRYLFDRHRDMVLPTAFLIDSNSAVIKVYSGYTDCAHILLDWQSAPVGTDSRLSKALPFPGQYLGKQMHHNYFTYGVAFLRYGYLDQALLFFQQAIDKNPSYAAAYYNTGLIYLTKHKVEDARANLQKAVDLDPSNATFWNNLGVACGKLGDYARALSAFQKALSLEPLHPLALQNIVKVYEFQGRSDDARKLLESAIAADPNQAELHMGLARLLVEKNDLPRARSEFESAVRLQPKNLEGLNGLGVVLMRMGKSADAIMRFEECRRLAPDFDRAYLNLALIYVKSGDTQKAHDILNEYLLTQPDSPDVRKALKEIEGGK